MVQLLMFYYATFQTGFSGLGTQTGQGTPKVATAISWMRNTRLFLGQEYNGNA